MLNLAREDVRQYVFNFLDQLVSENDIAFLKWDYNRNWTDPGWDAVPLDQQKEIYIKFVDNLYGILADLRKEHPRLEIESCSGGGGRVDLGILQYTDEVWPSDNTDALDRLVIQDGFTHAYSQNLMMAWVTDVPNRPGNRFIPLEFRFLVAMSGSLGIGGNLNNWSPDDMAIAKQFTAFYKQVRPTVQLGELHRLMPPENSETSAVQYVTADGRDAVVFAYLHSQHYQRPFPIVRLEGLDPKASYRLTPLDTKKSSGSNRTQRLSTDGRRCPIQPPGRLRCCGPALGTYQVSHQDSNPAKFAVRRQRDGPTTAQRNSASVDSILAESIYPHRRR